MLTIQKEELWQKTERLREELYDIANRKGLHSPEVIQVSQALDKLVNEYYRLK